MPADVAVGAGGARDAAEDADMRPARAVHDEQQHVASPNTNSSITGRDPNWTMKPSRQTPASKKRPPTKSTSAAAFAR